VILPFTTGVPIHDLAGLVPPHRADGRGRVQGQSTVSPAGWCVATGGASAGWLSRYAYRPQLCDFWTVRAPGSPDGGAFVRT
jgi:hypothetical protein